MKRTVLLFLALVMVLLSACSSVTDAPETLAGTQTVTEEAPQTTEPIQFPTIAEPLTPARLDEIPIARQGMSADQLRQICLDYFRLQLTFQWTPAKNLNYIVTTGGTSVSLSAGTVYAGIPYISESRPGSLYSLMQYYDPTTGILTPVSTGQNFLMLIGQHCAGGATWGWNRVVNSTKTQNGRTQKMNHAHGFLRVGPYSYPDDLDQWSREEGGLTTRQVCLNNGEDVMYRSYAELRPADGLVLVLVGGMHVRMVSSVHVERVNGVIDGEKSYVLFLDQGSSWESVTQPDGTVVNVQGGVDEKASFQQLYKSGYVPFTFAEFLGTDPVEEGVCTTSAPLGAQATVEELKGLTVTANYPIATVTFTVTDANGALLHKSIRAPSGSNYKFFEVKLISLITSALPHMKKSGATTEIAVRIGNGESFTVFSGTVIP